MALELTPPAVSSDGSFRVWIVDEATLTNPTAPSAAIITAAPSVTYSMTTDGFNRTSTQETETDPRLALRNVPETPGKVSDALEVTYVFGHEDDVMDPLVVEDQEAFIVARYAVDNEDAVAAGQKVDVIAGKWGKPRKNAPTANGKWTKTAKFFVTKVYEDVTTVA